MINIPCLAFTLWLFILIQLNPVWFLSHSPVSTALAEGSARSSAVFPSVFRMFGSAQCCSRTVEATVQLALTGWIQEISDRLISRILPWVSGRSWSLFLGIVPLFTFDHIIQQTDSQFKWPVTLKICGNLQDRHLKGFYTP